MTDALALRTRETPATRRGAPRWARVPSRAFEDRALGLGPLRILGLVCAHASRTGWCWAQTKRLAAEAGLHPRTVQRHMRTLVERGYITQRGSVPGRRGRGWRVLYDSDRADFATPSVASGATPSVAPIEQSIKTEKRNRASGASASDASRCLRRGEEEIDLDQDEEEITRVRVQEEDVPAEVADE